MSSHQTPQRRNSPGRPADMAKRAAIMTAAQTLFLELGYGATSMERIAEAAKVSKLTVYRHFRNKAALFAAAVAHKCELMLGSLGDPAIRATGARSALEAAGQAFLGLILHPEAFAMHQVIVGERLRSPELGKLFFDNAIELTRARISSLIDALIEQGALSGRSEDVANDYLALLRHRPMLLLEFGMVPIEGADLQAHIAHCAAVILRAYAPGQLHPHCG